MNTIGKILVVFIAISSFSFLAFVLAFCNGGPDWKGEVRSKDLQREFVFTTEPGETATYSVRHRRSETNIADKSKVLAEALLKARKRLEDDTNKRQQELNPQPQQIQDAINATVATIAADKKGVEAREQFYNEYLEKLVTEAQQIGDEFSELTIKSQDVLKVAEERRDEGYRIANQLSLLRNDKFAAEEQRKALENELTRIEDDRRRLQKRQSQLEKQLSNGYIGSDY